MRNKLPRRFQKGDVFDDCIHFVAIIENRSELLLQHKVNLDHRLIVSLAERPDGLRFTDLPRTFDDERFAFGVVFPFK